MFARSFEKIYLVLEFYKLWRTKTFSKLGGSVVDVSDLRSFSWLGFDVAKFETAALSVKHLLCELRQFRLIGPRSMSKSPSNDAIEIARMVNDLFEGSLFTSCLTMSGLQAVMEELLKQQGSQLNKDFIVQPTTDV